MGNTSSSAGRASLREVAQQAGVSVMTVSNVINRKKNVSDDTRRRVEAVIAELDYRPVQAARSLRTSRRDLVGLLMVDDSRMFLEDPVNGIIASSISDFLTERGFHLVLEHATTEKIDQIGSFQCQMLDAMIVIASGGRKTSEVVIRRLEGTGVPSVFVQSPLDTRRDGVAIVNQDDAGGGALLADHLVRQGIGSAMILGTQVEWHAFKRRRHALATRLSLQDVRIFHVEAGSDRPADALAAVDAFLAANPCPDAIVGLNDRLALAVLKCLRLRGIAVPEKVCVAGFNGLEMIDYVTPQLTVVRSAPRAVGTKAAELALASLKPDYRPATHLLPVELNIGETSRVV